MLFIIDQLEIIIKILSRANDHSSKGMGAGQQNLKQTGIYQLFCPIKTAMKAAKITSFFGKYLVISIAGIINITLQEKNGHFTYTNLCTYVCISAEKQFLR